MILAALLEYGLRIVYTLIHARCTIASTDRCVPESRVSMYQTCVFAERPEEVELKSITPPSLIIFSNVSLWRRWLAKCLQSVINTVKLVALCCVSTSNSQQTTLKEDVCMRIELEVASRIEYLHEIR